MIDQSTRRYQLTDKDLEVFDLLLPYNHLLQDFLNQIDREGIAQRLECYYSRDLGKPGIPPIYLLKMEFLRYFYRLSDLEVFERCRSDIAFR